MPGCGTERNVWLLGSQDLYSTCLNNLKDFERTEGCVRQYWVYISCNQDRLSFHFSEGGLGVQVETEHTMGVKRERDALLL